MTGQGGSGIVRGSQHSRDCGGEVHIRGSQTIKCAGYDNPRTPPDWSPRDPRVWLRQCLHVGHPIERCLDMPHE